jgi:hypothetical protein
MRKEIDILVEAARKDCAVVEKSSHLLWELPELIEARASGLYGDECPFLPPDGVLAVSGPFPGCCQLRGSAGGSAGYRAVGQTGHFVVFAPAYETVRFDKAASSAWPAGTAQSSGPPTN